MERVCQATQTHSPRGKEKGEPIALSVISVQGPHPLPSLLPKESSHVDFLD